jgi:hypothetical protein
VALEDLVGMKTLNARHLDKLIVRSSVFLLKKFTVRAVVWNFGPMLFHHSNSNPSKSNFHSIFTAQIKREKYFQFHFEKSITAFQDCNQPANLPVNPTKHDFNFVLIYPKICWHFFIKHQVIYHFSWFKSTNLLQTPDHSEEMSSFNT